MRFTLPALVALALIGAASPSLASPCRDTKGKFIKCTPAAAATVRCKDAKGKFAKCGAAGAKPIK